MKIILFKNTVESQEFFTYELAKAFKEKGHEIFLYDCNGQLGSFRRLIDFIELGNTVGFAFNFNGMINDDCLCSGREPVFWNRTGIPYINMIVDHPFYYHDEFINVPENYTNICIDMNHKRYYDRFFPGKGRSLYMPLAGTQLDNNMPLLPINDRKTDIIFTGNYIRPEHFEKYLDGCDEAVVTFYHEIRQHLYDNPDELLEEYAEKRIRDKFGKKVNDDYLRDCFRNMIFLDLQVRHYYRGKAVAAIADAGYDIDVYGAGYDTLECRHPEHLHTHGNVNSKKCLEAIAQSKVSLNVMPWFKDGAHDRVFNTMLNGAVSLSDHSRFLDDTFHDETDIVFYDLKNLSQLPEKYGNIINDSALLEYITENAYNKAFSSHTWASRAEELLKIFKTMLVKK